MKQAIERGLNLAVTVLINERVLMPDALERISIERTRDRAHGDFASNIALIVAKQAKRNPREVAQLILEHFPDVPEVEKLDIAGPGFINFTLVKNAHSQIISTIRIEGQNYGLSKMGAGQRVLVEFVSANPTGPLHVGHGRGAAYGDALVRLLKANGYAVEAEYYVNDAGRQMHILALSVYMRYLDLAGLEVTLPANGYKGDYVWDIAASLHRENGGAFVLDTDALFSELPDDLERAMDTLIERCQQGLGEANYNAVFEAGLNALVNDIRGDLAQFGVTFDQWFSERALVDSSAINDAIEVLKANDKLYEKEGAWWFRSSEDGDEKDRVVLRANGQHTYFAADIAYHLQKANRGFDQLINIWGADHHGYVARVKAAFKAMDKDPDALKVLLVQFAILYRGGEKVSMSTRGGDFVTLRELREEVGTDAARFFYVMRKSEQHMDFDLDLAKSQSSDNPVYYVQYAHARVCSVYRQLEEKGVQLDGDADLSLLVESHEIELMTELARYPEVLARAARDYAPHQVAYYLRDLANAFHTYYNAHPFISAEGDMRHARLVLIDAVRQVIANGLSLLGVSAPERM
ncbi:MAG: arginine--tRNA ligase [Proteobacteria bacterium]|nr:arginine--tRNA ligase [Pseudomonadota bacterium]